MKTYQSPLTYFTGFALIILFFYVFQFMSLANEADSTICIITVMTLTVLAPALLFIDHLIRTSKIRIQLKLFMQWTIICACSWYALDEILPILQQLVAS